MSVAQQNRTIRELSTRGNWKSEGKARQSKGLRFKFTKIKRKCVLDYWSVSCTIRAPCLFRDDLYCSSTGSCLHFTRSLFQLRSFTLSHQCPAGHWGGGEGVRTQKKPQPTKKAPQSFFHIKHFDLCLSISLLVSFTFIRDFMGLSLFPQKSIVLPLSSRDSKIL